MQPGSDKQDSNKQGSNSPSQGVYASYQTTLPPPPYAPYPQQFVGGAGYGPAGKPYIGQTPLHQQAGIVTAPVYQTIWRNKLATSITPSLRTFLIISGFIYSLWGILATSLQLAIVINSFSTYYHGFWTGAFLIITGIVMMIAAFRSYYPMIHLVRLYAINLGFCVVGLIFSVVNYSMSTRCTSFASIYCDDDLASHLKVILLITFIVALIHTTINQIFIAKEHQRTVSNSSVANC